MNSRAAPYSIQRVFKALSIQSAAGHRPALRLPLVELTGGEPLLQKHSLPLMQQLCEDGFTVLIETSGGSEPITCHGHWKGDAARMKALIEGYQTQYFRGGGPGPVGTGGSGR